MTPALELAERRYSCRRFLDRPLQETDQQTVQTFLTSLSEGPLGNRCRFALIAATPKDSEALKGLGTYGFIRGAAGFIVGTVRPGPRDLEDYGYCLESAVLKATEIGLGTCWLGGTFTKSSFAAKISAQEDETVPAVIALGYPARNSESHWIRRSAKGGLRQQHARLFFDQSPDSPLDMSKAGPFAEALEMVRWAPSASNKQPWRFVRVGDAWHLYLERTPGYGSGLVSSLVNKADLQRVDMGIAMCHFELGVKEAGFSGHWVAGPSASATSPVAEAAAAGWEYIASWIAD